MKNGNLYKLAALLMALVLLSALSFAQSNKKEIKKKKTMMITMTVDEDGETTKVDTIVFGMPDVDIDEIMKDIDIQMNIDEDRLKEIHTQLESEMDELQKTLRFEFEDHSDEVEEAMEELKNELKNLDMEEEVQERIQNAMKRVEEAGKMSRSHMKSFIVDGDHPVFIGDDGTYEVITNRKGKNIETKLIWKDEDGNVIEKENEIIIKSTDEDGKDVLIEMEGVDRSILTPSKEKDLDKAIAAGLPIDKKKMFEKMDLSIEIKDDQAPLIKIQTEADGKLKATAYDKDFNKLKRLKVSEEGDKNVIQLDTNELKDSETGYILLEQGGKTDLMRIHR